MENGVSLCECMSMPILSLISSMSLNVKCRVQFSPWNGVGWMPCIKRNVACSFLLMTSPCSGVGYRLLSVSSLCLRVNILCIVFRSLGKKKNSFALFENPKAGVVRRHCSIVYRLAPNNTNPIASI